jgi:thymidylate kinase
MKSKSDQKKHRFIYFAGVDGSGKSTVIDEIQREYRKKGIRSRAVWLRFNYCFTRPVLLFCRLFGFTRRVRKGNKIYSIHDFHKSSVIAYLVQYIHFIDTCYAYISKVWFPLKFTDDIILCDRFIYDILADFIVETRDLNLLNKFITKLFILILPKNVPVIFLTVDKDEIIKRKPEVLIDDEDYDLKYKAYELIKNKFSLNIIYNDNLENTVNMIKKLISI